MHKVHEPDKMVISDELRVCENYIAVNHMTIATLGEKKLVHNLHAECPKDLHGARWHLHRDEHEHALAH